MEGITGRQIHSSGSIEGLMLNDTDGRSIRWKKKGGLDSGTCGTSFGCGIAGWESDIGLEEEVTRMDCGFAFMCMEVMECLPRLREVKICFDRGG